MENNLSLLMITKNGQDTIEKSLLSVIKWVDEIVIIDDCSTDNTIKKVKSLKLKVKSSNLKLKIFENREDDLGKQRMFGLQKCANNWVLVLDSDEVVSEKLKREIVTLLHCYIVKYEGFFIPFQNHYLGRGLKHGGESYKKLVLFKKDKVIIKPGLVNERFEMPSKKIETLKNKIYHHSYRSISQMYKKFTDYGVRNAKEKVRKGESTSLKKIFLYPLHMFWARFIKDKGYKDGLFRIPLDIGFAYMEFLSYFLMVFL